jgi:hypothetical protein
VQYQPLVGTLFVGSGIPLQSAPSGPSLHALEQSEQKHVRLVDLKIGPRSFAIACCFRFKAPPARRRALLTINPAQVLRPVQPPWLRQMIFNQVEPRVLGLRAATLHGCAFVRVHGGLGSGCYVTNDGLVLLSTFRVPAQYVTMHAVMWNAPDATSGRLYEHGTFYRFNVRGSSGLIAALHAGASERFYRGPESGSSTALLQSQLGLLALIGVSVEHPRPRGRMPHEERGWRFSTLFQLGPAFGFDHAQTVAAVPALDLFFECTGCLERD